MPRKLTREEFIEKAQKANAKPNGEPKYIYDDKCIYINKRSDVTVLCPKHGYFNISAGNHLRGQGCKECGLEICRTVQLKTKEQFQKDLDKKYNSKYEIIGEYKGNKIETTFKCRRCGYEFKARPNDVMTGRRVCKQCYLETVKNKYAKDELISKFNEIHNNKYNYSILEDKIYYRNDEIEVICPKHGKFKTSVSLHLNGRGCYQCGMEKFTQARTIGVDKFKERLNEVNPNITFNEENYVDTNTPIYFTCLKCWYKFKRTPTNIFFVNPTCPNCEGYKSKLEKLIYDFLSKNKINFEIYKRFDWLGKKSLDFYLPDYSIAIECQGIQHFKPVEHFGGDKGFEETRTRDMDKRKLCEEHNIKIFYFSKLGIDYPYKVYEDENLLLEDIKNS